MKNTVRNFGIGKVMMAINFNELPDDIREGLIELTANRPDESKITDKTERILICGDVCPK